MRTRVWKSIVGAGVLLAAPAWSWAVLAEDYVAIHRLHRPDGVATSVSVQRPGISNAGDVFAVHGAENHEFGVRWLRSSGYAPDEVGRAPGHTRIQSRFVTSEGFVTGRNSGRALHYDMVNNVFSTVGQERHAEGYKGNNLGDIPADSNNG